MQYRSLPPVRQDAHVELSHFPSLLHAAVFRLWECVPAARIAYALGLDLACVQKVAAEIRATRRIAAREMQTALALYALMQKNPHIGYEAANHYYYNKESLRKR